MKSLNYPDNAKIVHVGSLIKKSTSNNWLVNVRSFPFMKERRTDNFPSLPELARGRIINQTKRVVDDRVLIKFAVPDVTDVTETKLSAFPDLYPKSDYIKSLESEQYAFSIPVNLNGSVVNILIPELELARITILQFSYLCRACMNSTSLLVDFDVSYDDEEDLLIIDVINNQVFPKLKEVNANIDYATLSEIEFNDLEINLSALAQSTQLKINGKEVRAEVSIPRILAQRPVFIEADYLRLNFKPEETEAQPSVGLKPIDDFGSPQDNEWLTHLPAIRFNCADCKVDSYQLDKLALDLDPADNGLLISKLTVDKGKHLFIGEGSWQKQKTNLSGKLVSKDIGELTDEFDLTSSIKESNAEIDIDLYWYGTPYQFNTQSLSGDLKWRLGDGYITDISDGGARVFSLLSLDSLVRKLKLDFRDVFAKGFFYNSMQGSMQVDKGVAYTKDTELNGVPADLTIKGYADLNTQKIDYTMWVAPEVTSSIPVIVAWMVNPVTGLAALAIDKVLHSARVISEIEYTITGTFEQPVVTEKGKKSREIEIPQSTLPGTPKQDVLPAEKKIVPLSDATMPNEQSKVDKTEGQNQ